jgi:hypothetical protein
MVWLVAIEAVIKPPWSGHYKKMVRDSKHLRPAENLR